MGLTENVISIVESNQRAYRFLWTKKNESEKTYRQLFENIAHECRITPNIKLTLEKTFDSGNKEQALSLENAVLLGILAKRIALLNSVFSKKYVEQVLDNAQDLDLSELNVLLSDDASEEELLGQLRVLNRLIPCISNYLRQTQEQYFHDSIDYDTNGYACFSLAFGACLLGASVFCFMIATGAPVFFTTFLGLAIFASFVALIGLGYKLASYIISNKLDEFSHDNDTQAFIKLDDHRTYMTQQLSELEAPIINSVFNQDNEKAQLGPHNKSSSYGFDKYSTLFRSIRNEDMPVRKVSEIIEERCLACL